MDCKQESMNARILNACAGGLAASMYVILILVVNAHDYAVMAVLSMYSGGVFLAVCMMAFFARSFIKGAASKIGLAFLGLLLIWAAAYCLAS